MWSEGWFGDDSGKGKWLPSRCRFGCLRSGNQVHIVQNAFIGSRFSSGTRRYRGLGREISWTQPFPALWASFVSLYLHLLVKCRIESIRFWWNFKGHRERGLRRGFRWRNWNHFISSICALLRSSMAQLPTISRQPTWTNWNRHCFLWRTALGRYCACSQSLRSLRGHSGLRLFWILFVTGNIRIYIFNSFLTACSWSFWGLGFSRLLRLLSTFIRHKIDIRLSVLGEVI